MKKERRKSKRLRRKLRNASSVRGKRRYKARSKRGRATKTKRRSLRRSSSLGRRGRKRSLPVSKRRKQLRKFRKLSNGAILARRRRAAGRSFRRKSLSIWIPSYRYDWMFHSPSADPGLSLDRRVWGRIRQQLPPGYSIPDKDFIRFVREKAGLAGG